LARKRQRPGALFGLPFSLRWLFKAIFNAVFLSASACAPSLRLARGLSTVFAHATNGYARNA